jgi:shikimate dehydrogenase
MIGAKTSVVALIGNPVRHSHSPAIQNFFIKKYSLDAVYLAFEFSEKNLKKAFNGAGKLGFEGLNVTMPYKEKISGMVDKKDSIARGTNSVNTVKFDKKKEISIGFNTDVMGFLKPLDKKNFSWTESRCLVIGAGGAARSAIYGMVLKKVKKIWVYNRTREKVRKIIKDFKTNPDNLIEPLDSISEPGGKVDDADLIVNCTPVGMNINSYRNLIPLPEKCNLKGKFVFDMVYDPVETLLIKKARREGAEAVRGIDLLVNQAALSFKIWFGILPEDDFIEEIKNRILTRISKKD